MKYKDNTTGEGFELIQVTPMGTVNVPDNYSYVKNIEIDMGNVVRNQECSISFKFISDSLKIRDVEGSCGCMNGSTVSNTDDGAQLLTITYASKRIGIQDKGSFNKVAAAVLSNGQRIKFKVFINESK